MPRSMCGTVSQRHGFTTLEILVTLAIIAILAAMSVSVVNSVSHRNAVALAPQQFQELVETTRTYAMETGYDTVLVVDGPDTALAAGQCSLLARTPANCLEYWIVQSSSGDGGVPLPFTDANLNASLVTNIASYRILDQGLLPETSYIGVYGTGVISSISIPATSVFANVNIPTAAVPCTFCEHNAPYIQGYLRFHNDGTLDFPAFAAGATQGGMIFFSASAGSTPVENSRPVIVLLPSGMTSDRLKAVIQ